MRKARSMTRSSISPGGRWCCWGLWALGLALSAGCTAGLGDAPENGAPDSAGVGGTSVASNAGGANMGSGATGGGGSVGTGASPAAGGAGAAGDEKAPLTARVWRLSHAQYRSSIVTLLGVEPDMSNFAPESGNGVFENFSSTNFVRVDLAANYYDIAKALALELPTEALRRLSSCDLSAMCRDTFIEEVGRKAFRSPVPPDVRTRLAALFDLASADANIEMGYRATLAGILNSPYFLYRKEIGPEDHESSVHFQLTDHQIAEFLSFAILNGPPPDWLVERVSDSSDLSSQLNEVVRLLLNEPAFHSQLTHFLSEWLEVTHFEGTEKTDVFPGFAEVKDSMEEEAITFLAASGGPDNGLADLLLDPVPSVSPALDRFYFSDPSSPEAAQRLGVLGLGVVLSSHAKTYLTSPTLRGTFVRKRFFCQEITLPLGFTPPPISETEELRVATSTRDLYERHQTDPTCARCHILTDPIGFALESFDGAGRFRTQDSTQGPPVPVDTTAELSRTDVDRMMSGPQDLSLALSESKLVKDCIARQAFRFYFGQVEHEDALPPAIFGAQGSFAADDTLRELLVGLLATESTIERTRGGTP